MKSNNRNKLANRNKMRVHTQQQLLDAQITKPVFRLVDLYYNAVDDTGDINIDLFTLLASSTDFADLKENFGEMRWDFVKVRGIPRIPYSSTASDCALGAVALRQGPYDVVTTYTVTQVLAMPGSLLINNHDHFQLPEMAIVQRGFYPTNITNSTSTSLPKLNLFFGWQTPASTNTGNLCLHIQVGLAVKSRIGY